MPRSNNQFPPGTNIAAIAGLRAGRLKTDNKWIPRPGDRISLVFHSESQDPACPDPITVEVTGGILDQSLYADLSIKSHRPRPNPTGRKDPKR